MAFERDFVERFKEDGRSALLSYHKGLKEAHQNMIPVVNGLMTITKPGDQRFTNHFSTLVQREEHNLMALIGPPDRADHELVHVPPQVGAMVYGAYAAFNAARVEQIKSNAPPEVIDHLNRVTHFLEGMAQEAQSATGRVTLPTGLINLAYDSVLAEVDPRGYEAAMAHAPSVTH